MRDDDEVIRAAILAHLRERRAFEERRDGRWLLTDRRWHVPSTRAHWIKGLL